MTRLNGSVRNATVFLVTAMLALFGLLGVAPATPAFAAPATFTNADHTSFTEGYAGTFLVTTSPGFPAVVFFEQGTLPSGVTFTVNATGVATLAGTPAAGSAGTYPITFVAADLDVQIQQQFTLTVLAPQAPTITSPLTITFTLGVPGSFTVTTTGAPTPSLTEPDPLPDGVSFVDNGDGTATFSGTPAVGSTGNYPMNLVASNGVAPDFHAAYLVVVGTPPTITSADNSTFTVGTHGTFTVTTTGGSPTPTLSVTGTLPAGVTFTDNSDGTATLAGTPAADTSDDYPLTITASNSTTPDAVQSFDLSVLGPPHFTTADKTTFTAGSMGSFVFTAVGDPAPTTMTESGALPRGVTFDDFGGGVAVLDGTPSATADGAWPITITASNGGLTNSSQQSFTLFVAEPPTIVSSGVATFAEGVTSDFTVRSAPASPPATLTELGPLPSGVTFTDNGDGTASLAGTPAAGTAGTYPLSFQASNGASPDATQSFTLTVALPQPPDITSAAAIPFVVGTPGSFTVTTTGAPTPVLTETGALPSGVTYTDNGDGTATIAGTPDAGSAGSYPLNVAAENGLTPSVAQSLTLTVAESPFFTTADSATFTVGVPGRFPVAASGGYPSPPTLSVRGTLPLGVLFLGEGRGLALLSGTPAAGTGGSYPLTLVADNGASPAATQQFTLTIDEPPAVTSADHTGFVLGSAGTFTVTTSGFPAPTLSESGSLPAGVTFTDNGDGTATLAGKPSSGSAGSYPLILTASNGVLFDDSRSFTLTVAKAGQSIIVNAPTSGVVGQTFTPTGTGGGSGNPVTFAVVSSPGAPCSMSGATVTLDHAGVCQLQANQAGSGDFAAGSTTWNVVADAAPTTTALVVEPDQLVATVTAVAPGAGTPDGNVVFIVDGARVGESALVDGVATLPYAVGSGETRVVSADYEGSADYLGSATSTARRDPTIRAHVQSVDAPHHGWFRSQVRITFTCTTNGAPLTGDCPAPVTLSHGGANQVVTRTIHATDGGTATYSRSFNLDFHAPRIRVLRLREPGGQLSAPRVIVRDRLSGVEAKLVTRRHVVRHGVPTLILRITARDWAGNVQRKTYYVHA